MDDPYGKFGQVYTGPGFRLPFYIVSPWTRGGNVFVENADHVSQIKFIEQWLLSKGFNATTNQIPSWRRQHMSDLTKAFNFNNPDYSLPTIPDVSDPSTNSGGTYNGWSNCESTYRTQRPPVPYGNQTEAGSFVSEQGFKVVRGDLTEGRFLVFEMNGYAIANLGSSYSGSAASAQHNTKPQRWIDHQQAANMKTFTFSSAIGGSFVGANGTLVSDEGSAAILTVTDLSGGKGYSLLSSSGYLSIGTDGKIAWSSAVVGFATFSVTYNS